MKTRSFRSDRSDSLDSVEPRAIAELSAAALVGNYHAIREQVAEHSILPMVKADAYGHGAAWAARELLGLPGLNGFGVATLEEGATLRSELGLRARKTRIVVFSGSTGFHGGWNEGVGQFCEQNGLTPVLGSDECWHAFWRQGWASRLPYELEFNTGMNRMGITPGLSAQIARTLRDEDGALHPGGVFTHLASAESPDSKLTRQQRERFAQIRADFASACPSTHFHIANSAAIWNQKVLGLGDGFTDLVRPGISLYGVPPWDDAPARGLSPVMTLKARVLTRYRLKAGESVGYGGTYVASAPTEIATLGAGYADGLVRSLKGKGGEAGGYAWVDGRRERFVGIVSMDLAAVTCSERTQPGDWVEWMGPRIDPWKQARAAGTVPYELLTSVSALPRVKRIYV